MSADLAVQRAIRDRLVGAPVVLALVPAHSILDRHAMPVPDPSIILGETVEGLAGAAGLDRVDLFHTLHVWRQEPSFEGVKQIVAAIRAAIRATRPQLEGGYHLAGWRLSSARYLRDPDGVSSHAVVVIEATVCGGAL